MKYRIIFEVVGRMSFPIDMLRYDACWPLRQEDVSRINSSLDTRERVAMTSDNKAISITLVTHARTKQDIHKPTKDRWASFGWHVCEIKVEKLT